MIRPPVKYILTGAMGAYIGVVLTFFLHTNITQWQFYSVYGAFAVLVIVLSLD